MRIWRRRPTIRSRVACDAPLLYTEIMKTRLTPSEQQSLDDLLVCMREVPHTLPKFGRNNLDWVNCFRLIARHAPTHGGDFLTITLADTSPHQRAANARSVLEMYDTFESQAMVAAALEMIKDGYGQDEMGCSLATAGSRIIELVSEDEDLQNTACVSWTDMIQHYRLADRTDLGQYGSAIHMVLEVLGSRDGDHMTDDGRSDPAYARLARQGGLRLLEPLLRVGVDLNTPMFLHIGNDGAPVTTLPLKWVCDHWKNEGRGVHLVDLLLDCGADWKQLTENPTTTPEVRDMLLSKRQVKFQQLAESTLALRGGGQYKHFM